MYGTGRKPPVSSYSYELLERKIHIKETEGGSLLKHLRGNDDTTGQIDV